MLRALFAGNSTADSVNCVVFLQVDVEVLWMLSAHLEPSEGESCDACGGGGVVGVGSHVMHAGGGSGRCGESCDACGESYDTCGGVM